MAIGGILGIIVNGIVSTLIMPGVYVLLSLKSPELKGTLNMMRRFIERRKGGAEK